ncbi:MAG TPA: hypothetical protein PKA93_00360 [Arachnia sp.]|nr:hypothetical protein [Arachnia sp.]
MPSSTPTDSPTPPLAESTPPTSLPPVGQPDPQGGPWEKVGATLTTAADARALTSVPESLRAFLAARIGHEDDAGCTVTEVVLMGVHRDGFAFGTEDTTCGGAHTVWGIAEGQWEYVVQYEDAMPCEFVAQNDIPRGVPGLRCVGDEGAEDY